MDTPITVPQITYVSNILNYNPFIYNIYIYIFIYNKLPNNITNNNESVYVNLYVFSSFINLGTTSL